jgi:perosamine synthetase
MSCCSRSESRLSLPNLQATPDRPKSASGVIPYGRQWIEDDDVSAVSEILRSDWLTTGPAVDSFEQALAARVQVKHGVAVSSGTAALHAAIYALGIGPGDEVIVPPMTFAATSNCVVYQGGTPVFADVDENSLLIDPEQVSSKITSHTKAIIAVDYAGQPCDYQALRRIAEPQGIALVADACHALGARDNGKFVGTLADLTVFSFHPVKHITTGEGGMIVTDNPELATRMRRFRNHGITTEHRQRSERGSWKYEMVDLGFNYRISDFQCALGQSQLEKLDGWLIRRQEIADRYTEAFLGSSARPLSVRDGVQHAWHLYVVQIAPHCDRAATFAALRESGIGVNVHYIPVHFHPYYRQRFGTGEGLCPVAEAAYERILSLPMFPKMTDADVDVVIAAMHKIVG